MKIGKFTTKRLLISLAICSSLGFGLWWVFDKPTHIETQVPQSQHQPEQVVAAAPKVVAVPCNETPEFLEAAERRNGEGKEKPLIREMRLCPAYFGFTGDLTDANNVKLQAWHQAHLFAIRAGWVDWKFGGEIGDRRTSRVAYIPQKTADDTFQIAEVQHTAAGDKIHTQQLAKDYHAATFLGDPGMHNQLQSYEYINIGTEG